MTLENCHTEKDEQPNTPVICHRMHCPIDKRVVYSSSSAAMSTALYEASWPRNAAVCSTANMGQGYIGEVSHSVW